MVTFHSGHENYGNVERAIDLVSDGLNGVREHYVYKIVGETIEIHMADIGGGPPVEVLA